jgi:hypothetical protein
MAWVARAALAAMVYYGSKLQLSTISLLLLRSKAHFGSLQEMLLCNFLVARWLKLKMVLLFHYSIVVTVS